MLTTNRVLLPIVRKAVADASKAGHFMAPSSRAGHGPYRVTLVAGRAVACTCKGYNFYGRCYHVNEFNQLVDTVAR